MTYNFKLLFELKKIRKIIAERKSHEISNICSIGYFDFFIPKSLNIDSLRISFPRLPECLVENKDAFIYHEICPTKYHYVDIKTLFNDLKLDYYWIDQSLSPRNQACNDKLIKLNLNERIYSHLYSKFDIIIDSGSAANIFNIGQVFENYYYMLRPGGFISQYLPYYCPNSGFWHANPTLLFNIARSNDLQIIFFELQGYKSKEAYYHGIYDILKHDKIDFESSKYCMILMHYILKKNKKSIFVFPSLQE